MCPVSRPTKILGCFLKRDSCLLETFGLSTTISRLPLAVLLCILSSWLYLFLVPMNPSQDALLARLSATSLPRTLKCPGTQISLTLLNKDSRLSSVIVSATNFDTVLAVFSAFNATWLSEHIIIIKCKKLPFYSNV